jgi:REP element-mobilizing transposase RayT
MLPVPWDWSCPAACIALTARIICTLSLALVTDDCLFWVLRERAILDETRQRYRFVIVGYVVMPEHIHLLVTEPEVGTPSTVMQVLKERTARALLPKKKREDPRQRGQFGDGTTRRAFWQARFYDFNVWTTKKRVEKLRVHASQSGETRTGGLARTLAMEQLPLLFPRRNRPGSGESRVDRDFVSRSGGVASPLRALPYPPLQKAQGRGAPQPRLAQTRIRREKGRIAQEKRPLPGQGLVQVLSRLEGDLCGELHATGTASAEEGVSDADVTGRLERIVAGVLSGERIG